MNEIKQEYDRLHSLGKLVFAMSCVVVVLFLIIKFDENVPLWVMIAAVVIAVFDGFLMVGYAHNKDTFTKHMKEREERHE